MYKFIILFILLLFVVNTSYAETIEESIVAPKGQNFADNEEAENPDEAGAAMPSVGISEEKVIVEVVEGVGHIPYNRMAFRDKPSLTGRVLRYSSGAEKVLLIGETPEWYKVIMYNNKEAYIQKKYVRTTKLFMDETVSKNKMNKTLSIELDDLLVKFEETLRNSNYAKKNQIRPVFKLVESKNDKNIVTLIFYYSCANTKGEPVPSYNNNDLYAYMQQFVELILGRLILAPAEEFNIVIKVPTYDDTGNVIDYNKEYALIHLNPANVNMEEVRSKNVSILSLAESTVPVKDLFKTYPK